MLLQRIVDGLMALLKGATKHSLSVDMLKEDLELLGASADVIEVVAQLWGAGVAVS